MEKSFYNFTDTHKASNNRRSTRKNLEATLLFVDISKAFVLIHRGKIEIILLAYGLPRETITAKMMLYKNTKAMGCSPDGDTDFFNIVTGVFKGETFAPCLLIMC